MILIIRTGGTNIADFLAWRVRVSARWSATFVRTLWDRGSPHTA
ncbi:MAG TPA: hypothetical protein VGD56_22520 [Gemmatirosa sp.]